MAFDVAADAYQQFMGAYSDLLAPAFADFAGVGHGYAADVLDVGCGPGSLTAELARRAGAERVHAVDPSPTFVAAVRARLPEVTVSQTGAEQIPYPAASFGAALAQLVVHFMSDPAGGVAEMARVTVPGGVVAATVWDLAGGRSPLSLFWDAVTSLRPGTHTESTRTGARQGDLTGLLGAAGLHDIEETELPANRHYDGFDDWWRPFTFGVGPAGDHVRSLDEDARERLRDRCRQMLPSGPFTLDAIAWAARGTR